MESSTETVIVVDVGSLFARNQTLKDQRKPRGKRYSLTTVLIIILLAKLCGEHHFLGIAGWVKLNSVRQFSHTCFKCDYPILADSAAMNLRPYVL